MASIQQRFTKKDGEHYRVRVRLKGFPPQMATFRRKTDAKRWAQQTEAAIREGRYFRTVEAQRRTVADLVDRYLESELSSISPHEAEQRRRQLRWWKAKFGCYRVGDFTPSRIAEGRERLLKGEGLSGRRITPATCNRYLAALSHAFTIAVQEWEWLQHNPVRNVRRRPEPRGRVRFLSEEERHRLLVACQATDGRLYALVVAAVSTGARSGELLSLRWPDVDLVAGRAVFHHTKNGERRSVPLTGPALAILQRRSCVRRLDTNHVFAGSRGMATFPRKHWLKALERAGIADFRFHDLRHTAASYLAMNGATLAKIAEILGHKTLAMVKRYAHLTEQHTARVVERMNRQIFPDGVAIGEGEAAAG